MDLFTIRITHQLHHNVKINTLTWNQILNSPVLLGGNSDDYCVQC
jgi:hypothetical protein